MYLRYDHAELYAPTLREFIRENPLGVLTTAIDNPSFPFLQSTHLPWLIDVEDNDSETELGILRAHLARANPHAKALIAAAKACAIETEELPHGPVILKRDVMVMFTASSHHYIPPKFLTATKPTTGKVVPTWNYAAVQAYGTATIYFDPSHPSTDAFLTGAVKDLTTMAERGIHPEAPWTVDEAPPAYIESLKKAIMGVSVKITKLSGKWKMSQELNAGDRAGTIAGFQAMDSDIGHDMARMIDERGKMKAEKASCPR
ncbi:hypothetical protein HKX48_003605 [Thoreauomyces humboldtii]|nr:hypothetical protein HKX48_003605 [Thoreauomyces humboldtii]